MRDRSLVAIGLAAFLALAALPVWNGLAATGDTGRPLLERAADPTGCVEDTLYMKASHQELLNQWRDAVVRRGERYYTAASGRQFEMSLTRTCLSCHADRDAFCTRCHDYANVQPTCWDCHVDPGGSWPWTRAGGAS